MLGNGSGVKDRVCCTGVVSGYLPKAIKPI